MTPVSEISRLLAERTLPVCLMLLPGGREVRSEYVAGSVTGGEGDSLKVHLNGGHAGQWKDWANPEDRGDLLDLWRAARGLSPGEAIEQAKDFLGIRDGAAPAQKKSYQSPQPKLLLQPPTPQGRAFKWLTEKRKLSPETLATFGVETQPGKEPAIVFPSFSPTGQLVNRSYRTLPKAGEQKKVWQDKGCAPSLFGWQSITKATLTERTITLAEGQIDAMTWHQWGIPCLSIPAGTGQTWIEFEWDNLQAFDRIYVAFDTDDAGQENAERAIKRLGPHRCLTVSIPFKDANEALQGGATAEKAAQWIADAKSADVTGLVTAASLEKRVLTEIRARPKAFTISAFDRGWPYDGFYFRPGEVTMWTGAYGNGKSTFLNYLTMMLLNERTPVFFAGLEVKSEVTLRRLIIASLTFAGFYFTGDAFRDDGGEIAMDHAFRCWLADSGGNLTFADVVGYIEPERLFEMMLFSFRKHGSRHFFIDSFMRIQGLEEDWPAQGMFMNRLQEFAKDTGGHIHLVAHPKKMLPGGRPSGMDTKGSSMLPNNVDNIGSVVRNHEKMEILKERDLTSEEQEMHDTEITVDKQRETGWLGSFYFRFDRRDFSFKPCSKISKPRQAPRRAGKDW